MLVGVEILWEEEGFQFAFKRWQGWTVSCESEFQVWGPKQEKARKPLLLRLYCWIFCMRVSEEERSVRDGVYKHVAVEKGKQDQNHS